MLNGFEVIPSPFLEGCKRGIVNGNKLFVSPAYASLLKSAKTEKELVALLESLGVVNIGPPEHDAQWHADTWQIQMAAFNRLMGASRS